MVLVGLSGSGKTAVGRLVAGELGASLVDVDARIEAEEGLSVSRIFVERGEQVFRELERRAVELTLSSDPCVVVPGGGWAAQDGNLADASGKCTTIYLQTTPSEAAGRVAREGNRPLLAGGDPVQRLAEMLEARARFYERADHVVATDGRSVAEVARDVLALARSGAAW